MDQIISNVKLQLSASERNRRGHIIKAPQIRKRGIPENHHAELLIMENGGGLHGLR